VPLLCCACLIAEAIGSGRQRQGRQLQAQLLEPELFEVEVAELCELKKPSQFMNSFDSLDSCNSLDSTLSSLFSPTSLALLIILAVAAWRYNNRRPHQVQVMKVYKRPIIASKTIRVQFFTTKQVMSLLCCVVLRECRSYIEVSFLNTNTL